MSSIKLMHGKIHRATVTEADRDYVGSITIDRTLLEKVGILPFEEVDIVNVSNGNRWQTYALPGEAGSGKICPNGGGALLCKPGDILIIWANEYLEREKVLTSGHTAKVITMNEKNQVNDFFEQKLSPSINGWEFHNDMDKEGKRKP